MQFNDRYSRFFDLTYEDFRVLAKDTSLSRHEKVGFPDSYREGSEELIFKDILNKLPVLHGTCNSILEIGPGCSQLPIMLSKYCAEKNHTLSLIDSKEMLDHIPDASYIRKYAGRFPGQLDPHFELTDLGFDAIIIYSVIQYVFQDESLFSFVDTCFSILNSGGYMLIGDIPNLSMRKRFLESDTGIAFHKSYAGADSMPDLTYNCIEKGKIDDPIVISIVMRARSQGLHAWIVPQALNLPMSNRREDIIIQKP